MAFRSLSEVLSFLSDTAGVETLKLRVQVKLADEVDSKGKVKTAKLSAVVNTSHLADSSPSGKVNALLNAEQGKKPGKDVTLTNPVEDDELTREATGDKISREAAAQIYAAHRGIELPTENTRAGSLDTLKNGNGVPA